jgi:hypothetical protein
LTERAPVTPAELEEFLLVLKRHHVATISFDGISLTFTPEAFFERPAKDTDEPAPPPLPKNDPDLPPIQELMLNGGLLPNSR